MTTDERHGVRVLWLAPDGGAVSAGDGASDLIGDAWSEQADVIAIPTSRLDRDFFDLSTRQAGEFLQKLVNYRLRVAILGDVSEHIAASEAFAAFVRESNRADHVWFLPDAAALDDRLAARRA